MTEKEAIELLITKQNKIKLDMWYLMTNLADPSTILEHCGYRNGLGEALISVLADTKRALAKEERAFLKLFPDK
jgi:hypothetical protein